MRAHIPISALAIALAAGAAYAGGNENERHGGSTAQFKALDRNSDQRLSQSEAASDTSLSGKFAALDVDGDGYVTMREYTARMQKEQQDEQSRTPMERTPDQPRDPY